MDGGGGVEVGGLGNWDLVSGIHDITIDSARWSVSLQKDSTTDSYLLETTVGSDRNSFRRLGSIVHKSTRNLRSLNRLLLES